MKIHIITPIYNEEYLIPIFLNNYKYASRITFLYDSDTNDNTLSIINKNKNVNQIIDIIPFNTGDGLNDSIMINLTNEQIKNSDCDYIFCVDADELLFTKDFDFEIIKYIENTNEEFYNVCLFQMYPHYTEEIDLDKTTPIWEQRHYGFNHPDYTKPAIIKANCNLSFGVGKHYVFKNGNPMRKSQVDFIGCHLNNVNLKQSIIRRINNRKCRISQYNRQRKFGVQHFNVTEEIIIEEYKKIYNKLW